MVVWPASPPVPNMSISNLTLRSFEPAGVAAFTPNRVWRTPAKKLPSSPYCLSYDGSFDTFIVSYQLGSIWVKFAPKSTIAKP